jgi:hypothetical protein
MREPLKWYDASATDNPPWIIALNEVRHLATREGWCHQHVQAIIVAIDQYAEAAARRYSLKPDALKGVHMSVGQQLGVDMATNFMLMTLFSLLADMAEDPDGFRTNVKRALFDLTDNYKVAGVAPEIVKEAREAAKQVIAGVLQNVKPLTHQ